VQVSAASVIMQVLVPGKKREHQNTHSHPTRVGFAPMICVAS
jgi:hypothetical protein